MSPRISYTVSTANFDPDEKVGLAQAVDYQWHRLQVRCARQLNDHWGAGIEYRLTDFAQPSAGGASDFQAHGAFVTLTWQ